MGVLFWYSSSYEDSIDKLLFSSFLASASASLTTYNHSSDSEVISIEKAVKTILVCMTSSLDTGRKDGRHSSSLCCLLIFVFDMPCKDGSIKVVSYDLSIYVIIINN